MITAQEISSRLNAIKGQPAKRYRDITQIPTATEICELLHITRSDLDAAMALSTAQEAQRS